MYIFIVRFLLVIGMVCVVFSTLQTVLLLPLANRFRLLQASEGYARHSGCRFRKGSFSELPGPRLSMVSLEIQQGL